jgi:thermitase
LERFVLTVLSICTVLVLYMPTSTAAFSATPTPPPRVDVAAPVVPGQFVIKFKPGTSSHARQAVVHARGGRVFERIPDLDIEAAEFPILKGGANSHATEALINALTRHPNVEFVEPNYIYTVTYTPNDPGLSNQYAWNTIKAYAAWDATQGSSSTVIAIIDTGIQRSHPDLDTKIVAGYDFVQSDTAPDDGQGHGTHVAGTAAAKTNNRTGVAGTCPNCKLMPVRVLDNNGGGTLVNIAKGINYAADHGAHVINLSLISGTFSTTLQNAVDYAWNKGVFLACAAGNSNTNNPASAYPAAYPNCFAVASTTSSDVRSSFSNYGSWVDVAAPGSSIYSTVINSRYTTASGTSMATPHVAGLAGLLAAQGLTNTQIRQRICDTADKISGTGTAWRCGRINADRAVKGVDNGDLIIDEKESSFSSVGTWGKSTCGYAEHTYWTYTTDGSNGISSENSATWRPKLPTTGRYNVLVHIPQGCGISNRTTNARYQVQHAYGTTTVPLDQNTTASWVELGTFQFNTGTNGSVRLTDLTSEPFSARKVILFDAVQWVPLEPATTPSSPAVLISATLRSSRLAAGEVARVDFTVKNISSAPLETQAPAGGIPTDPATGWIYDEADCFSSQDPALNFPKVEGRLRVTLGFTTDSAKVPLNCNSSEAIYPWRWGLGTPLQPGETRTISGYIRFRTPGTYKLRANLVHEWIKYYGIDGTGSELQLGQITVTPERIKIYIPYVIR